jgi:hypothetical protein
VLYPAKSRDFPSIPDFRESLTGHRGLFFRDFLRALSSYYGLPKTRRLLPLRAAAPLPITPIIYGNMIDLAGNPAPFCFHHASVIKGLSSKFP